MSFFKSLAHAFGFGGNENPEDNEVNALSESNSAETDTPVHEPVMDLGYSADDDFPAEFFDNVLEIFNNTQPDFIRECIDKEAQRRYLHGVLGNSFKDCIGRCRASIEKDVVKRVSAERDNMINEIATLKGKLESIENHEARLKDAKLSADRQKRAFSDKIKSLEQQVASLEAEKEQYKLEVSSLLNKIEAKETVVVENQSENSSETSELKTRLSQANFVSEQLRQEVERLKKELAETAELYKSRMAISDKMLTDIRNANRNSSKELEESKSGIAALQEKYEKAVGEVEKLNEELKEARATLATADEVMVKMEQFESVLKKRDEKIQKMKDVNEELLSKISSLESENKRLNADLETNIMARASSEKEFRQTIDELSKNVKAPVPEKPRRKRKTAPKISAIDETIDSTEWLVSTPPEDTPKVTPAVSDSEFGYQEPPKKSHPVNDAQMSLF